MNRKKVNLKHVSKCLKDKNKYPISELISKYKNKFYHVYYTIPDLKLDDLMFISGLKIFKIKEYIK